MPSQEPVIETQGLTKRYGGETVAVDDLDLGVEAGEVYGFLGPNGAGKSTTIDMLVGVTRPTAGSASVLGHDAETDPVAVRQLTGVLPGEFGLFDRLTAREHVEFALQCRGTNGDPDAVLDTVGLGGAAGQPAREFSTGMRRRLALAMALAGSPPVLVLDEPTRGLDPNGARQVRSLVRAEADRGTTVFFSSHSLAQVEAVCDRVGVLRDGRLVAEGTVAALTERFDDHRFVLTVDDVPDGLGERLTRLEAVTSVQVEGRDVVVSLTDATGKAPVVDAVESAGAVVTDIETGDRSLAEFFAAVTTEDATTPAEGTESHADESAAATGGGDA